MNTSLTKGKLLTRNVVYNLVGQGLPLVVAIFTIPVLIEGLGVERFGVLTLVWVLIGYASLFDFGLGRALTQLIATRIDSANEDIPPLIRAAIGAMMALGLVSALGIWELAPWISSILVDISDPLRHETANALRLIAFALPVIIVTTGLRGILEAYQQFVFINVVRIPLGLTTFLGPLVVLFFSTNLAYIVATLVLVRIITVGAFLFMCLRIVPTLATEHSIDPSHLKLLFSFGSWMTISNIVAPLMLYADRFIIAGLVSASAVAYYTTPYEVVTKLWIVPNAILGVLFPAFGLEFSRNTQRAKRLYHQSLKYIFLLLVPVVLLTLLFAEQGLKVWLDADFARHSTRIAQLLALGVLVNSLAQASATLVQAAGRPDITAKLHLLEFLPYLGYLWLLVSRFGIVGAATAWLIRVSLSCLVLSIVADRLFENSATPNFTEQRQKTYGDKV